LGSQTAALLESPRAACDPGEPDGKFSLSGSLDAGHPNAGKSTSGPFILPHGMDGQTLVLPWADRRESRRAPRHRWACAQPLNARWLAYHPAEEQLG